MSEQNSTQTPEPDLSTYAQRLGRKLLSAPVQPQDEAPATTPAPAATEAPAPQDGPAEPGIHPLPDGRSYSAPPRAAANSTPQQTRWMPQLHRATSSAPGTL